MPKPRAGESESDFVNRCTPILIGEGREQKQAVAICHSLYTEGKSTFYVTKQANGTYRWFAVYSNPYRDRDHPPEILTEAAQIDNAKAINSGAWPYPELWLYHIPGSRCGVADLAAYDTDNRLAIASGLFDAGKEMIAEALNSTPTPLKTSHGFPRNEVRRDTSDPTIITRFRTKEISPLPEDAAANELTGFKILGGNMNLIPEKVKERLGKLFPAEDVEKIAGALDTMGDEAKELSLEFKEVEEGAVEEPVEAPVEKSIEEPVEEPVDEKSTDAPVDDETLSRKEVEDAVKMLVTALESMSLSIKELEATNATLQSELSTLSTRLDSMEKSDEEKIAAQAAFTPRLSLSEIVQNSVIGKEAVHVDGRKARHEGPQETVVSKSIVNSGHPVMDEILTDIVTRGAPLGGQ